MTDIAVWHPYFGNGGAESVCMNVLQALQSDHNLTLFVLNDIDIGEQNKYFDTKVSETLDVRHIGHIGTALNLSSRFLKRTTGRRLGRIHASLLSRFASKRADEFGLAISTHGEFSVTTRSIQYIHYPWFNRSHIPSTIERTSFLESLYNQASHLFADHDDNLIQNSTLLTNSEWSADLIANIYDVQPNVVYPPVQTNGFNLQPWSERENGFVTISRLKPNKNILRNIRIVTRLRNRGHDVHLHLVGPASESKYKDLVENESDKYEYIHLEGRVPRTKLIKLLCNHKYGLHGKEYEHFGIAVAEMVAAGVIPFVPNSGGQREIVNTRDLLLYNNATEAVEKANQVLTKSTLQKELLADLPDVPKQFNPARFRSEIRDIVSKTLSRAPRNNE